MIYFLSQFMDWFRGKNTGHPPYWMTNGIWLSMIPSDQLKWGFARCTREHMILRRFARYIYIYIHIYIYVYIYIMYIYIYLCIYIHIELCYICIYLFTYIHLMLELSRVKYEYCNYPYNIQVGLVDPPLVPQLRALKHHCWNVWPHKK